MNTDPFSPMGDRALIVHCGDNDEARAVAAAVTAHSQGLGSKEGHDVIEDVVPAAASVLVVYAGPGPFTARRAAIATAVATAGEPDSEALREVTLKTRYDGQDLHLVARHAHLTPSEVIDLHTAVEYRVAFLGFVPGFAYLIGGADKLRVPRRADPRTSVPAGSVAIANGMTAVYPRRSPGGWQLIGTTNATLFDPSRESPSLLTVGARVRFIPT